MGIAALVMAPIVVLAGLAAQGSGGLWSHLATNVLPTALHDTILLLLGVGILVSAIGTGTAWLVSAYEFPGRRALSWALLLPLSVPTYIIAYTYLDILHPIGPVQTALRAVLGIASPRDFRLPDIRSMGGCILLLSFVLYPYVYLTTRAMFQTQAAGLIEAARVLGTRKVALFFRVALPLAHPAIAVGVSLALMEALNDIGASEFLGVRTLSVSIYTTWITRSDLPGAAQIALVMLLVVIMLVMAERWARRHRRYAASTKRSHPLKRVILKGPAAAGAIVLCVIPIVLGFVGPAVYLVSESIKRVRFGGISSSIIRELLNTITVSFIATLAVVCLGLVVAYAARLERGRRLSAISLRVASLGYAIPGTVLAIGMLPLITGLDAVLDDIVQSIWNVPLRLWLLGTGSGLVIAYTVRFMAISIGGIEAGFTRVPASLDDASRTLGKSAGSTLRQVHFPLIRPAVAAAALLVFVDVMKELPVTLLLRPLNFETLATHLYGEAARGTYEEAAIAALLIVAAGIIPVVVLGRADQKT
ncbi:ABC transporter permease [Microvirga antarctica]|uniref:ABC transporter permease n=1 Tax=Microvirga antarctica TaxID=2819233 RepID=UPI001B30DE11|nr:iron ABC transporter permease [Microvirga antarctica]